MGNNRRISLLPSGSIVIDSHHKSVPLINLFQRYFFSLLQRIYTSKQNLFKKQTLQHSKQELNKSFKACSSCLLQNILNREGDFYNKKQKKLL